MEKVFGVYTHSRPDGEVFYVGKGPEKRANCLKRPYNKWYTNVVSKYGEPSICVKFYPCANELEALNKEVDLIAILRASGAKIVNQTDGGQGMSGHKPTAETIAKRAKKLLGQKRTHEQRLNISKGLIGKNKGKKKSAETRAKMSANSGARNKSPEWIAKMTANRTPVSPTKEHREKLQAAALIANTGRKQTDATKQKIRESLLKRKLARPTSSTNEPVTANRGK